MAGLNKTVRLSCPIQRPRQATFGLSLELKRLGSLWSWLRDRKGFVQSYRASGTEPRQDTLLVWACRERVGGWVAFVRVRKANLVEAGWVPFPAPRHQVRRRWHLLPSVPAVFCPYAHTCSEILVCASVCDASNVMEK